MVKCKRCEKEIVGVGVKERQTTTRKLASSVDERRHRDGQRSPGGTTLPGDQVHKPLPEKAPPSGRGAAAVRPPLPAR
ncbi:hypothetical protein LSTR_LSTR014133 [Laodelphax striatellus]|uniref:Uncharacterized protein n=1 Tax=Laodelphax striatellus TaxID=195883 RepID=A0A482X0T6_LAOST|nr:hypothetical protein LSTR_LSTR014133 [Laodelphax striatellus]